MKKEESAQLKDGQIVYIAAEYINANSDDKSAYIKIPITDQRAIRLVRITNADAFEYIINPSSIEEGTPKYDPCRKFRKGDIAKPRLVNNRPYSNYFSKHTGVVVRVLKDEDPENKGFIYVDVPGDGEEKIDPAYLELVTPVEELEPYCVNLIYDCDDGTLIGYEVARENGVKEAIFYGGKGCIRTLNQAKAAAEDERDRLNAEYRTQNAESGWRINKTTKTQTTNNE